MLKIPTIKSTGFILATLTALFLEQHTSCLSPRENRPEQNRFTRKETGAFQPEHQYQNDTGRVSARI